MISPPPSHADLDRQIDVAWDACDSVAYDMCVSKSTVFIQIEESRCHNAWRTLRTWD